MMPSAPRPNETVVHKPAARRKKTVVPCNDAGGGGKPSRKKSSAKVIASALLRLDQGIPISKEDLEDYPGHTVEERIRVTVRVRPMPSQGRKSGRRKSHGTMKVANIVNDGAISMANKLAREPKMFHYDHVFG